MTHVFASLLPVLTMMALGAWLRRGEKLSRACVDGMKFLATKVILPVAIFNALATAEYTADVAANVLIMLVMLIVSFALGFVLKGFIRPPYRKYVPFMVSVYEGGMIAYPLYTALCGAENLSRVAVLDIAGLIFGFSVYMSLLYRTDRGEGMDIKSLLTDSLRNPAFIASVLGLIAGLTGSGAFLTASAVGEAYSAAVSMVTSPLSALILLIVGYELSPRRDRLGVCLGTIALRAVLQAVMIIGVLWAMRRFTNPDPLTELAVVMYMSAPATFSMQSFVSSEEGSAYVSTVNSLYVFISVAVYAAASVFVV